MAKKISTYILTPLVLMAAFPALANTYIERHIPDVEPVGSGRFSAFLWDIYDATLYAPKGAWQDGQPLALQLSYLRALNGKMIADRSVEEMRKHGVDDEVKLATWHTQMRQIFPDVDDGVTLTGIYLNTGETLFYKNGREIGRIDDPAFADAFFGIWLNPKTTAPDLRKKLIGLK